MISQPLSPDDRAMEQGKALRKNAAGVATEAHVATLLAVPEAKRTPFAHGRARQASANAAIESVALSCLGVAEAVPELSTSQTGEYGAGWNAARKRMLDDLGRLRGALVAQRRQSFEIRAAPGSLLADPTFVEALHLLWCLDSNQVCRWDVRTGLCTVHPKHSAGSHECDYDEVKGLLQRMGFDPFADDIMNLWHEMKDRREHAEALAAGLPELPEEGDAGAAQQ
jgi:hypothetical protein